MLHDLNPAHAYGIILLVLFLRRHGLTATDRLSRGVCLWVLIPLVAFDPGPYGWTQVLSLLVSVWLLVRVAQAREALPSNSALLPRWIALVLWLAVPFLITAFPDGSFLSIATNIDITWGLILAAYAAQLIGALFLHMPCLSPERRWRQDLIGALLLVNLAATVTFGYPNLGVLVGIVISLAGPAYVERSRQLVDERSCDLVRWRKYVRQLGSWCKCRIVGLLATTAVLMAVSLTKGILGTGSLLLALLAVAYVRHSSVSQERETPTNRPHWLLRTWPITITALAVLVTGQLGHTVLNLCHGTLEPVHSIPADWRRWPVPMSTAPSIFEIHALHEPQTTAYPNGYVKSYLRDPKLCEANRISLNDWFGNDNFRGPGQLVLHNWHGTYVVAGSRWLDGRFDEEFVVAFTRAPGTRLLFHPELAWGKVALMVSMVASLVSILLAIALAFPSRHAGRTTLGRATRTVLLASFLFPGLAYCLATGHDEPPEVYSIP